VFDRSVLKIVNAFGCTPRGAVSFVSDCYGGSVSDRQIIEDSNILDNSMFDSSDSIMADRGHLLHFRVPGENHVPVTSH
jgi:hypothetical protein